MRRTASRRRRTTRQSNALTPLGLLVGVLTVVAVVVACIWQHRAATAGRALGIPSRHSPAWGVGSWFVPVVNLWIPYAAVRDCLPAGHPQRTRVLHWWIAWLLTSVLTTGAGACALFSTGAALVVSVPAALACLAVIAWAPGIVRGDRRVPRRGVGRRRPETGVIPGLSPPRLNPSLRCGNPN